MTRIGEYLELTKPRITALVVVTAVVAYVAATGGDLRISALAGLAAGTALSAGGTNALNQWWERALDARMDRTRSRPLPSGRLSPGPALVFGISTSVLGVLLLWTATTATTGAIAGATVLLYVGLYTPLKRATPACTYVGAVPGALPVLGGWAAADGSLAPAGWGLFGVVLLWQLPHFFALDWLSREDYGRAGFRTVAVEDPTGERSARHAAGCALALLPVSLLPLQDPSIGALYAAAAVLGGLLFLVPAAGFLFRARAPWARRLFGASLAYLPVVLTAAAMDVLL